MSAEPRLLRSVVWTRSDWPALENCRLLESADGLLLRGHVVAVLDDQPVSCDYEVSCSKEWQTRAVQVRLEQDSGTRVLLLASDAHLRWRRDGEELPGFQGLMDIDLAISPATNTLPIRRLRLDPGQHAEVTALWVQFPDLELERLTQRYTRMSERVYRYQSGDGEFQADLEVDELGLIVRYGTYWDRSAQGPAPVRTGP